MVMDYSLFLFLLLSSLFYPSSQNPLKPSQNLTPLLKNGSNFSLSFPLSLSKSHSPSSLPLLSNSLSSSLKQNRKSNPKLRINSLAFKSSFRYTMALIISLPIGTPPQSQEMVLDTGSQLSWVKCDKKLPPKKTPVYSSSFDPSLSSSFSLLPCTHPICKPRIPDFTIPTSCDENRLCHYSYFYADGTLAEGNLVSEKISFSNSQITPPLTLGCTRETKDSQGILGMNLGRLSFTSQTNILIFSYCVPLRRNRATSTGTFYLGHNPNSSGFKYVDLLIYGQGESQRMPNFDPAAYTVLMQGIRIGGKKLNIPPAVFRPDRGGAGQTMIDSGTEYTFLVKEACDKVRDEVLRLVGPSKVKKDFVYQGALDLCFNGNVIEIGRLIGDIVLEFDKGVEIVVKKERVLTDIGGGVGCLSIGRSDLLGVSSNIIGNFHQQNLWVEFDVANRRVGFGETDCTA